MGVISTEHVAMFNVNMADAPTSGVKASPGTTDVVTVRSYLLFIYVLM
jgi:hypothetical protein